MLCGPCRWRGAGRTLGRPRERAAGVDQQFLGPRGLERKPSHVGDRRPAELRRSTHSPATEPWFLSGLVLILGCVSACLRLPAWVVPPLHAVEECARVVDRRLELGPYRATRRDVGVSAALVWLTLGEVSPMTWRPCTTSTRGVEPAREPGTAPVEWWRSGVTFEVARAESWVALSMAAGQVRADRRGLADARRRAAARRRRRRPGVRLRRVADAVVAARGARGLPDLHLVAPGGGPAAGPAAPVRAAARR